MTAPARRASFEILQSVEIGGSFSDEALHSERVGRLRPVDRNLTTEIVYGTLRWRGWLDHLLAAAVASRWNDVDPRLRILLRMSLYQMARMSRLPDHAIINDAVELAARGFKSNVRGFVNAVLRRLSRERPWSAEGFDAGLPAWVRTSMPRWLWRRWRARFGDQQAEAFALSLNRPPARAFRFIEGNAAGSPPEGAEPSDIVPGAYILRGDMPAGAPAEPACVHFQDEASQLVPYLLGPSPGKRVWDVCAAPGGKTAILLGLVGGGGVVVASDASLARLAMMRDRLPKPPGVRCELLAADATRSAPFLGSFDAVLVDAPCSGLGTLRRNPEIKWRFRPARLELLQKAQGMILEGAAGAVRPGGKLLYATCSTEPEENEEVVDAFLARHDEFRLARPQYPPGIEPFLDSRGMFRSFPCDRLWDGFFAALMVRAA